MPRSAPKRADGPEFLGALALQPLAGAGAGPQPRRRIHHPLSRTMLGSSSSAPLAILVMFLLASSGGLHAQLPAARLSSVFPPGGKAGSTLEVSVSGSDLDEPSQLHFSHKEITGTPGPDANRFAVTIGAGVTPGVYEVRVVGRFGISNPRAFVVGTYPEINAPTTNTTAASALELIPNVTLNGTVSANAVSWFKFTAKKSQRLLIECLARSIDSRMDAALVLGDASGRELERSRTGGVLDFIAPADGVYLLKVLDFLYRGGDDCFYRLTLSSGPRIDFVMPPAGLPGTRTGYTLYGRNLPNGKPARDLTIEGKPLDQLAVEIDIPTNDRTRQRLSTGLLVRPAEAGVDGFEYRLGTPKGISNPVLLGFATAPVVLEQEPNNTPAEAQRITPPCEVAGLFHPNGEQDWFTFDAKNGDVFWVEVFSQRLGLPTDPFVLIQRVKKNDKGEEQTSDVQELYDGDTNIGEREFNTATRDPAARFEVKEDGTYRLLVRDLFQRMERSPRFFYRLSVRREAPDFRLIAQVLAPKLKADAKDIPVGVPVLRRGETFPVRVMAFRRDGFNGAIELSIENPPPGLLFAGDRIEAGKNSDFILLTAADDAPASAGPIKLIGKAKIGDAEVVREARGGTTVFSVANTDSERPEARLAREFVLSISDKENAPMSIAPAERKTWDAPANAKLEIPLRVVRRGDFNANLKLKPLGPGAPEALKEFEVDGKATNSTLKLDLAALKLTPGNYVFAVQGLTTGKYRNNPEAAERAGAAAKEADKLAAELAATAKKAGVDFDQAKKSADDTAAAARSAQEKLADAKAAAEKSPEDEKLKAELAAAKTASEEAAASGKVATEAQAAAEKTKSSADARAKKAQSKKEDLAKRATELTEKAKPKEVTIMVHSEPIQIKVTAVEQVSSK